MANRSEAKLGMDISDYEKKLAKATNELNKFVKGGVGNLGNLGNAFSALTGRGGGSLSSLLGSLGGLAATFGATATAAGVMKDSIDTAMNFEKSMSSLKALTGLGDDAMDELKSAAIDMGSTTTQSASQVADAFKLIGSAKPELLGNVSALRDVTKQAITLAEAAGIDVPQAASALTTSLNQMGAGADQASRFINVLAAGSQKGAGDINWLNAAITQSGTAAKAVGTEYEELVANLEQLAQGGFEAGSAGTALRSIIMSLEKQSNSRLKPSVVGLTQAFRNLGDETKTISEYQAIVGKEFASQAKILADNAEKADEMTRAITGTSTAEQQAKINSDNFAGAVTSLKSAWEGLMLTINDSNGILRGWVDNTTRLINNIRYLVSSSDKQAEMGANAMLFGNGNNGKLAEIKSKMDATAAEGWSTDIVTERAQKDLDMWYYVLRGQHHNDKEYLAALELAYKKATQYVQDYFKSANEAKTETQNLGEALDNATGESIAHLKELLKEANAALENATTDEGRKAAQKLISTYEREIARMSGKGKKGTSIDNEAIAHYQQQLMKAYSALDNATTDEGRQAAQKLISTYEKEIAKLLGKSKKGVTPDNQVIGYYQQQLAKAYADLDNATTDEGKHAAQKLISTYEREITRLLGKSKSVAAYDDGAIGYYQQQLKKAYEAFEDATTDEGRQAAQKLISTYEKEITRLLGSSANGITFDEGSLGYYQQQLKMANAAVISATDSEAREAARRTVEIYEREIARLKDGATTPGTARINTDIRSITGIGAAASKMDTSGVKKRYEDDEEYLQLLKDVDAFQRDNMVDSVGMLADAFSSLGDAIGGTTGDIISLIGTMAQQVLQGVMTIANLKSQAAAYDATALRLGKDAALQSADAAAKMANTTASASAGIAAAASVPGLTASAVAAKMDANAQVADASAKVLNAHAWIPFVGIAMGVGMIATLAATLSSLPKFAEGAYADRPTLGIFGEQGPELVVPERKLDEAFERNAGKMGMGGKVEFKIRDTELVGVLESYEARKSRRI